MDNELEHDLGSRLRGGHISIIAMTAHAMGGDREICLNAGMDAYITKPFRPDIIASVLNSLGDEHQSENGKKKPSKKSPPEEVKEGDEVALPMIQAFEFEKIVIDGKEFNVDVMIYPNGQIKKWKRKDEHDLRSGDVKKILKQNPKLLIFGLGTVGNLTVSPTVYEELEKAGIDVLAFKTDKAVETYKAQREEEGTAALFHLGD